MKISAFLRRGLAPLALVWIAACDDGNGTGPARSLAVQADRATVEVGRSVQLTASLPGGGAPASAVAWTSGDTTRAKVTESGLVTTFAAGQVEITASADGMRGSTTLRIDPASTAGSFRQVSAGGKHACAIDGNGRTYCWGTGHGLAGGSSPTPVLVPGGHAFRSVNAGGDFSCGVAASGAVYCWGLGDEGQLGTTAAGGSCPRFDATVPCSTTPVPVRRAQARLD